MNLIVEVFVIFAAAKAAGELFVRLRQPAIVGELLVGVALGPHVLEVIHVNQATTVLSELGIVVLLFTAGLETRLSDLLALGRTSLFASLAGMALAAGTGFALVSGFGYSTRAAVLAATALAASSVGIAARAFSDMGALRARPARVVLGAAVVDDVAVLAALPLAQGVDSGASWWGVLIGLVGAIGFIVLVSTVGSRLARRHGAVLERPRIGRSPFVLALLLCLGLAALAEQVGLAALIGAFLAGMVLAETQERYALAHQMEPLFDFLVPFFFVVSAARMDPSSLADAGPLFVGLLVVSTLLAKFAGCGAGALRIERRERLVVGAGMLPRGEVTLAVAAAGLSSGRLPVEVFSALVAAVLVSAVLAAPLLKSLVPETERRAPPARPEIPPEAFELDESRDEDGSS